MSGVFRRIAVAMLASLSLLSISRLMTAQNPPPPGVGIQAEALPKVGTVGDPIRIDWNITMPPGYRAEIPGFEPQVGDFSIIEFFPGPAVPEAEKPQTLPQSQANADAPSQHHRARIVTAIYKPGKFSFPSFQILLHTPEGKTVILSSPPVTIEIRSVLAGNDQNLKDLKKQAEIRAPVRWILWLTIALAACILGAVGILLWKRYRRRSLILPSSPKQDPFDLAEAELRDLLARGLTENGHVKKFYVLLSEIVKRILESGYGIHTQEKTTLEIMDSLRRCPGLNTEDLAHIEPFLLQCDVVKFARYIPSKSENDAATDSALGILAEARKAVSSRQSVVGSGQ
jgi:hypothetical protein